MKIKWDDESLTPTDFARRLLYFETEMIELWWEDWDEERRPTQAQIEAVNRVLSRMIESVRRRHKLAYNAGANPAPVAKTGD